MSVTTASSAISTLRGGEWLLKDSDADTVFTPERLTHEHRLIAQTAQAVVDNEILPQLDRLEQKDWALARQFLKRCGELGLLGADVPEAYGGVGARQGHLDASSARSCRAPRPSASTFGAQANLCALPLMLFGTEAQKQKYLPKLMTGEVVGAYCLSESGSGSDALGAKTKATRQADGSFVLNGEKMWITNGGFADVFIVFAKVDGEHFTAFIVERAFPGVSNGKEEHKMGLHGSSTTPVILQDVRVPAENLLGEVGKGHKVAFNVLNFGRFKLGAMCSGGAQGAVGEAAKYAAQRKQFGQPIASFGAIKHKLGEMTVRAYALESLLYRTAGMIDARIDATPHELTDGSAALAAFEEFAIEASIAKVAGSEALDFILDENVQIHGGNGFVHDYPAERHYRDARVNRIFEGTNEINRLLIPGMLARRAVKGDMAVIAAAKALQDELMGPSDDGGARRLASRRRTARGPGFQEGGADGMWHRHADLRCEALRTAGSADASGRHADRRLLGRERRAAGDRRIDTEHRPGPPACGRRTRLRERRGDAGRRVRPPGARRDGRRRYAAHAAGGPSAAHQGHADQYGRAATPPRGRNRGPRELYLRVKGGWGR